MKVAEVELTWAMLKPYKDKYVSRHTKQLFDRVSQMVELSHPDPDTPVSDEDEPVAVKCDEKVPN